MKGRTIEIDVDRIESTLKSLERMATGDILQRIPISPTRDVFDAIAFTINILADEVEFRYDADAKHAAELATAVAELKRTQAQLVQSAKMAALGEFSSGIAHEINNPLTLVRLHVTQLESQVNSSALASDTQILDGLRRIDMNVDRMARTVKHVQDFSRPTEGQKSPISINEVALSVLELTSEQLRIRNVDLRTALSEGNPIVEANFHALEHVLLNLISNACDAVEMVETKSLLLLSTEIEGSDAILSLEDNGIGIPAENVDRLFEPFFSTKPPGKGTGLGLSISYQIVKDHDGSIECHSTPARGTVFKVRLPLEPLANS